MEGQTRMNTKESKLTIRFGDALNFILLLDSVAVRGALRRIDQLVSEALGNSLDATERGLSRLSSIRTRTVRVCQTGRSFDNETNALHCT